MAIRSYLTTTVGLSHLFMLNDNIRDAGSNGVATSGSLTGGAGAFVASPVCEGVNNSLESVTVAGATGVSNCFVIGNTADINVGTNIWQQYGIMLWFSIPFVDVPTCVYEQGGGTNNMAINVGLGRAITSQAADAGEDFLIAQSNFQAQSNKPYFVTHYWQRFDQHAGAGNKIGLCINGVLQEEVEGGSTASFPNHSGDVVVGNSDDTLQSYNGSTQRYNARVKSVNALGLIANGIIDESQSRVIFERMVLPTNTIVADTVANQQAALDALSGTTFQGDNCAIRIEQATDATDYRLFVDNINFIQDSTVRDIAVQYVGPNTLTLENANGSDVVEISTPDEVDQSLDGSSILLGGGSIALVEDTVRVNSVADQTNVIATKIVIEQAGSYTFTNVLVSELENVSGGTVNIISDTAIPLVTDTSGTTVLIDGSLDFSSAGDWTVYATEADRDNNVNPVQSGTSAQTYNFQFVATTTYWLRIVRGGVVFLIQSTPSTAGTTQVNLTTEALLSTLTVDGIADAVWDEARADHNNAGTTGAALKVLNDGLQGASLLIPHTLDVD